MVKKLDGIENYIFLHKNKKKLRLDIQITEICLVTREIMDTLLEGIDADYIIQVPISQDLKIKLKDAVIYKEEEFLSLRKKKIKNFDHDNNIDNIKLISISFH